MAVKRSQPLSPSPHELKSIKRAFRHQNNIPDQPPARNGPTGPKGKTSGYGITRFVFTMFHNNEVLDRPLTDQALMQMILHEFPHVDPEHEDYGQFWDHNTSINGLRGRYNRGEYSMKMRPEQVSFRYNSKGDIVDSKYGSRILTKQEVAEKLKYWDEFWQKKEQALLDKDNAARSTYGK